MATGAETGTQRSPGAIWTLVVVALATFMLMLDLTVVNVALPDIRIAFGSSFSALQWILDAYALGLAGVLLAAGSLADRVGRKKVFDIGLVVFVLSSLACGLAPSDVVLIVARFVQGLGGAILFAVGPALLGHEFRGKDRGMAFGVFGAVTGLAIAFGPLIGGGLTESAGWRWIFLINVPLTAIAIAIGMLKMRESRSETPPPVDWPGMVAFSAGLFLLVLGFMRGEADGWTSFTVLGCFGLALALLGVFTWLQFARPDQAMFDLSLFGNRTFNGLSAVTALCAITVMPALFLLIAYVQNMLGHSAFASGLRFLPLTLLLFVAAALAGALVTRVRPGLLVGASQLLIAAGLAAVLLVDTDSSWTALIPAMILIGLGMGVFSPPRAAFSIAVTTPDKSGMASGINETFQQAGVAIGIAAVGAFFQNRVSGAFTGNEAAQRVFEEQVHTAGDAVAAAGPSAVLADLPGSVAGTVRAAAETAFVDGLHSTMLLVAVLAAISGVIALVTMRWSDLDEAALDNPGVPADEDGTDGAGRAGRADTAAPIAVPGRRATGRTSALAAQRAAEIIAQAKADAQRETEAVGVAETTAPADAGAPVRTRATRSATAGEPARPNAARAGAPGSRTAGGRAADSPARSAEARSTTRSGGQRPGSTRDGAVTERPTDILERPTPPSERAGTASTGLPGADAAPTPSASGRSTDKTSRSADATAATSAASGSAVVTPPAGAATSAPARSAASDFGTTAPEPLDPDAVAGSLDVSAVRKISVGSERPARGGKSARKPKRQESTGKHRLAEPEPPAGRAAGRHRLTAPTPDGTSPTRPGPAPSGTASSGSGTASSSSGIGSGASVGATSGATGGSSARTSPSTASTTVGTASATTPGASATTRSASTTNATSAGSARTATVTARALLTDVIPRPTAERTRNGRTVKPATTNGRAVTHSAPSAATTADGPTTGGQASTATTAADSDEPAPDKRASTDTATAADSTGVEVTSARTPSSAAGQAKTGDQASPATARSTETATVSAGTDETTPAAAASTADTTGGHSAVDATAAQSATESESARPARRSTSRQRTRSTARTAKQPAEQQPESSTRTRASRAAGKPAADASSTDAPEQPAKATRKPAKKAASGTTRRTPAKKTASAAESTASGRTRRTKSAADDTDGAQSGAAKKATPRTAASKTAASKATASKATASKATASKATAKKTAGKPAAAAPETSSASEAGPAAEN